MSLRTSLQLFKYTNTALHHGTVKVSDVFSYTETIIVNNVLSLEKNWKFGTYNNKLILLKTQSYRKFTITLSLQEKVIVNLQNYWKSKNAEDDLKLI